jgi:hypothetical protein
MKLYLSEGKVIHEVLSCLIAVDLFDSFWSLINSINHRKQTVLNFTHLKVAFYLELVKGLKIRRFSLNQTAI